MNGLIAKSLRPFQVARALIGSGFLGHSGSLPSAERLVGRATQLVNGLRERLHLDRPAISSRVQGPFVDPPAPMDEEVTRPSHPSPLRADIRVDEASWESFPASDPPGY